MAFDDGDKAFIKLAVMEGFNDHVETYHKPLEERVRKSENKITAWGGGLAVIIGLWEFLKR